MRPRFAALGIAVLVALAMLVWLGRRDSGDDDSSPAGDRATAASPAAGTSPGAAKARVAPSAIAVPAGPSRAGISTDDPLTFYQKANVYPPTSRPLTANQTDLLYPNRRHEQPQPTDADDGVVFLFTADKYFVIGDDALTATLTATRADKPLQVAITKAYYVVLDPLHHRETPIDFAFRPEGTRIAPAALQLARQSSVGVYVEFTYPGGKQRAHFDFQYTPASGVPATFTGQFTDSVVSGSLVVHAGVDVSIAGDYLIDCNLFDAANNPVAWTRFKAPLAAGPQTADLLFFGKVLVDGGVAGPYHIGELRGAHYDPTKDPDLEQMPPYAGTYTTQAYPLTAFSSAEWDSPQKQKTLEFLRDQKQHGVMQGGATPADPGMPSPPGTDK